MRKISAKKITAYLFFFLIMYVGIGSLLHLVIFPEEKPAVENWFKPGQTFYSKAEGFRQTVVKQKDGLVYCTLEMEPFAPGPPKHIHTGFDEIFEIKNGELTIWINGKIKRIKPGEILHIPKGVPHKPFNETADTIHLKEAFSFPEKFAFNLVQVYHVMDNDPEFVKMPGMLFQMTLFQTNGFDSYLADGPPVIIQKAMGFILAPALRVLGYRSYYKNHDPFIHAE